MDLGSDANSIGALREGAIHSANCGGDFAMPRALLAQSNDRQSEVPLHAAQQAVPRLWQELPRPAQQQLAQLMARLVLRMSQPRVCPLKGEPDVGQNN
jgi:hypothetical protein